MTLVARDIMSTDVVTIEPGTTLSEAGRTFVDARISGAPVVTSGGHLIGIVTKADIINRCLEGRLAPEQSRFVLGFLGLDRLPLSGSEMASEAEALGTVDDLMVEDVITVTPEASLVEVAEKMGENRIHRIVVVDGGTVVGIITSMDLLANWPAAE